MEKIREAMSIREEGGQSFIFYQFLFFFHLSLLAWQTGVFKPFFGGFTERTPCFGLFWLVITKKGDLGGF